MSDEASLSETARKYRDRFQAFLDGEIAFKELEDWYWPERKSDLHRGANGQRPHLQSLWEALYFARIDSAIDSYVPNWTLPSRHIGPAVSDEELRHDLQRAVTSLNRLITSSP